jgi:DNA-binding SARP family transcriptional activator/Flp pilus assembly protein TadD
MSCQNHVTLPASASASDGVIQATGGEPAKAMMVGLLGPLLVSMAGRPVELPAGRVCTLLAVLAMSPGVTVSADRLATALWGADPPGDARANVRTNVRRLRGVLGAGLVETRRGGYVLGIGADQVDALRMVRLLEEAAAAPDPDRATERARLVEAVALWRGTPFDGVTSDWLEQTVSPWLQERHLAGLERRVDLDMALGLGRDHDLVAELDELATRFPLRESLWARLLRALERSGRPAEALQRYETIRARLAEELGTDPSPELQRLYAGLLAGGAPAPAHRVMPRQLPTTVDGFAGREAELKALDGLLSRHDGRGPRAVVVAAITGTAGIGKTTLAVHWSHRVPDRFPDGQLYVNLRGFDPSGRALEPAEALSGLLDALQVAPQELPASLAAQAGLYRSLLAGKRMLVLLDNARDTDQVDPLLPGTPGCLILVTSRNELAGLVTRGAHPISLDVLTHDEARQLLASRLGHDRVSAEPEATDEIIDRSAGLPLALTIVAARAATHPASPLSTFASQLRDTRDSLGMLAGGDTATDVRAVFSWSYRLLSPQVARLFRLVGLHPGLHMATGAAASLAGMPVPQVRPLLADLVRAHLLVEQIPDRYACHDLLRAYAAELTRAHDDGSDRRAALHRLLDHYLHTARAAARRLYPHGETITLIAPQPGVSTADLTQPDQATAWFLAEHPVLLAAMEQAAANGFDRHVCHLAVSMFVFLHRRGHWHDRAVTQQAALDAARRLGDRTEQARAHRNLAAAAADLGRFDDADLHLRRALELSGAAGDPLGQAWVHYRRNLVYAVQCRSDDALDAAQQALDLFQTAGDLAGQAMALTDVGWYHGRLGNHQRALVLCRQALALHQELDNRTYQAHTWSCLAEIHHHIGDRPQAIACYEQALALFREFGDRYAEASTLAHLGASHYAAGDSDAARQVWWRAWELLDGLDPSAADQIRTQLHQLDPFAAAAFPARLEAAGPDVREPPRFGGGSRGSWVSG